MSNLTTTLEHYPTPAKAAGIGSVKGNIAAGWDADFILLKPNQSYISAIRRLGVSLIASVYVTGQEVAKY